MSVWFAIPSARPEADVLPLIECWQNFGYKVAMVRDSLLPRDAVDYQVGFAPYPGYAASVNYLAKEILKRDPNCKWIVTGGDDTLPDPNKRADVIAAELTAHFGGTFGVMQPTGDRFAGGSIDRIAGSPWMGREWCERANGGAGPLWPEFTHMFGDQTMKETAEKLGVYWMRRDLTHFHAHFMRASEDINSPAVKAVIPPHLVQWNTQKHWDEMEAIYKRLKAEDFAPCMPLPVEVCA